jgi:hypothetical protein
VLAVTESVFDADRSARLVRSDGDQGGTPIVTSLDVDHDGRIDHIRYDLDGDGNAELVTVDENNDGVPDTVYRDDDDNGRVEAIYHDYDHDGRFENVWRDTDGDGYIDTITEDADGDGVPEKTQYVGSPYAELRGPLHAVQTQSATAVEGHGQAHAFGAGALADAPPPHLATATDATPFDALPIDASALDPAAAFDPGVADPHLAGDPVLDPAAVPGLHPNQAIGLEPLDSGPPDGQLQAIDRDALDPLDL